MTDKATSNGITHDAIERQIFVPSDVQAFPHSNVAIAGTLMGLRPIR